MCCAARQSQRWSFPTPACEREGPIPTAALGALGRKRFGDETGSHPPGGGGHTPVPPQACPLAASPKPIGTRWDLRRGVGNEDAALHPPPRPPRDALEGEGPQRRPLKRLDRRLEEVAEAVRGGYCRLQMPLRRALGVRGTVAGRRLGALEGGGGGSCPCNVSLPHPQGPSNARQTTCPRLLSPGGVQVCHPPILPDRSGARHTGGCSACARSCCWPATHRRSSPRGSGP